VYTGLAGNHSLWLDRWSGEELFGQWLGFIQKAKKRTDWVRLFALLLGADI